MLILVIVLPTGRAAADLRIFELRHRQAGELVETIRELLDSKAKVSAFRNVLVVDAAPDQLQTVAELLAVVDSAPAMLRITVEQEQSASEKGREVGGALRVERGDVAIRAGSAPVRGGATGRVASDDVAVSVSARDSARRTSHATSQYIMVLEGQAARISVGRLIPFASRLRQYCHRHSGCVQRVERVEILKVDTGFEVAPVFQGERVQLDISPFMAFPDDRRGDRFVFHELATRVIVNVGEWLDLGGQLSSDNELGREILRLGREASQSEMSVRLRVDRE